MNDMYEEFKNKVLSCIDNTHYMQVEGVDEDYYEKFNATISRVRTDTYKVEMSSGSCKNITKIVCKEDLFEMSFTKKLKNIYIKDNDVSISNFGSIKILNKNMLMQILNLSGFQLVGSRNIGMNTSESDYDYMTTDKNQFIKMCQLLDTQDKWDLNYKDTNSISAEDYAYYHRVYPHLVQDETIDFNEKQHVCIDDVEFDICLVTEILSNEEQIKLHNEKYKNNDKIIKDLFDECFKTLNKAQLLKSVIDNKDYYVKKINEILTK